jgi:hypothetical protein
MGAAIIIESEYTGIKRIPNEANLGPPAGLLMSRVVIPAFS